MVAGGGASVIYADTVGDLGFAEELGNYAEYSGAPNMQARPPPPSRRRTGSSYEYGIGLKMKEGSPTHPPTHPPAPPCPLTKLGWRTL